MARLIRTVCAASGVIAAALATTTGALVTASLATAAAAQAAVPKTGSWDSGSHTEPTVSFEVRREAGRRVIRRLSVPQMCKGVPEPTGEQWFDPAAPVRAGGRIRISDVLQGRFVTPDRAELTLRMGYGDCAGKWRFVVRHTRPRIPVRTGRWLALVEGATATLEFEVRAFGRVAEAQFLTGSVPATCSDGAQRSLLLMPSFFLIVGPIRPAGRFDASGSGGHQTISVSGTFDHGSVAALLNVTEALPDATTCRARGVKVVGALGFPYG